MRLASLLHIDRNASRLKDIVTVLGKYGLADWLSGLHYDWIQDRLRSLDGQPIRTLTTEARIRLALTELGPTFIKLGQVLSTRADVIGPALAKELVLLQTDTPADPPEAVTKLIEAELGRPVDRVFQSFDPIPMASASIGQAHRAVLFGGTPVIVKVQHAGVEDKIKQDLEILGGLAEIAQKHSQQLALYQPVALVSEFRRTLLHEIDFARERRNLEEFAHNFADNPVIHIPKVYSQFSSRRVLTMEALEGIRISDAATLRASGANLEEFARRGANMYLDMIFRDGFFHADPHPGNLLLLPGEVVGVVDCGKVGRIDEEFRTEIEELLFGIADRDADRITEVIVRLGSVPPEFDREALRSEVALLLADHMGRSLVEFDISEVLISMVEIIRRYHVILPSNLAQLLKVLVMLEGTSKQLKPDFSLAGVLEPYYIKAVRRRFAPDRLFKRFRHSVRDWDRLLEAMPRDLSDILTRVRRGSFDVHLEHRRLDVIVNRLVLGILSAALFMGSAELWSRQVPPLIDGVSVFGILGCAVAVFIGFRVYVAVKKSDDIRPKE